MAEIVYENHGIDREDSEKNNFVGNSERQIIGSCEN